MSLAAVRLSRTLVKVNDPLEMDEPIRIKQEVVELDDFEGICTRYANDSITGNKNGIKILPFAKKVQTRKELSAFSSKTVNIKEESPCNCMQNIEYYCTKCYKTLCDINEVKQCSECNNQLKLQCRLCRRRYKLLNRVHQFSISANIKKEIDIKEEVHFSCCKCNFKTTDQSSLDDHIIQNNHQPNITSVNYSSAASRSINAGVLYCNKCDFSTKVKENLNNHIFKSHWQPKSDIKLNCDDDMYIELLCKQCQKICRKVVYEDLVKLVCKECKVPMLYKCTLCRTSYKLLKNARYHVKFVCPYRTNNEKFYCADCTFKAETKIKLENHIVKEHMSIQCLHCNEMFENDDDLKKHVLEEHTMKENNIYPPKSELPFREPIEEEEKFVIVHNNPHTLVKNISGKPSKDIKEWRTLVDYLCLECGGEANKKFSRYRPWCRKCNLKYDYRCVSCEKLYGNYDRIHRHVMFGCPNRMVFACPICKYNASKKNLLFNHIETIHTIYKCMECFINIEGSLEKIKHETINCSENRPHTAEQLEKSISFYCKQCQKKPRRVANTDKSKCGKCNIILNYQCLTCLKVVDSKISVYKHVKELCNPNFHCEKCSFKTYTQEKLNIHTQYKHLQRMCSDCGVSFRDELIFQLHRREEIRKKSIAAFPHPKRVKAS